MEKTVFIFGAGASAEDGGPLMSDLIDSAEMLKAEKKCGPYATDFDLVFDALEQLQRVFYKATLDTRNLETVFNAFEMATLLKRVGTLDAEKVAELVPAMQRVIRCTLEERIRFPKVGHEFVLPERWGNLGKLAKQLGRDLAFISFNYDCALDLALKKAIGNFDYCYAGASTQAHEIKLLKLHGSLNWFQNGTSLQHVWPELTYASEGTHSRITIDAPNGGGNSATAPVIIPPSFRKADQHKQLQAVWVEAANVLSTAENVIVMGFSLPPTDEFFRYLYAVGSVGKTRIKRFWVIDAFPSDALSKRFMSLLGPEVRERFRVFACSFKDFWSFPQFYDQHNIDWTKLCGHLEKRDRQLHAGKSDDTLPAITFGR